MMNRTYQKLFCLLAVGVAALLNVPCFAQPQTSPKLSVHWEELTASDFRDGIRRSQGT